MFSFILPCEWLQRGWEPWILTVLVLQRSADALPTATTRDILPLANRILFDMGSFWDLHFINHATIPIQLCAITV